MHPLTTKVMYMDVLCGIPTMTRADRFLLKGSRYSAARTIVAVGT